METLIWLEVVEGEDGVMHAAFIRTKGNEERELRGFWWVNRDRKRSVEISTGHPDGAERGLCMCLLFQPKKQEQI